MASRGSLLLLLHTLLQSSSACSPSATVLDFSAATLASSENVLWNNDNLPGGYQRYRSVANGIDLLIETVSPYKPANANKNGFYAGSTNCSTSNCSFGQINLYNFWHGAADSGSSEGSESKCNAVDLKFSFCASGGSGNACDRQVLDEVSFTVFDMDELATRQNPGSPLGSEQIYADGYDNYVLASDTQVCVMTPNGTQVGNCDSLKEPPQSLSYGSTGCTTASGRTIFKATERGINSDNPTTMQTLSADQLARSVMLSYRNVESFELTFEIVCTDECTAEGRNMQFGGASPQLLSLCPPNPHPPPPPPPFAPPPSPISSPPPLSS